MASDLHMHTTYSDGRLTPEELVAAAKDAGLRYMAITDHDTVGGIGHLYETGMYPCKSIRIIPGIEFSAHHPLREIHILGYNIDIFINGQFVKSVIQGKPQQSLDVTPYLQKGKNEIRYRTSKAADAGTSSTATAELSLSTVTAQQGNAFELTGQYGKVLIKSTDGERMYFINVIVP